MRLLSSLFRESGRSYLTAALVSVLLALAIAGFTFIPGEVISGILSQEGPSEVELPEPFTPDIPLGQKVEEGVRIGYQLRFREKEVLEIMAGWSDSPAKAPDLDSLLRWRQDLGEPVWFPLPERRSVHGNGVENLRGIQSELKQKQTLLQEARVLWRSASSSQVREEARVRALALEADCNRLSAQLEARLQSTEKSPPNTSPVYPWKLLIRSADSLLRQAEVKAPQTGILEQRSIPPDGKERMVFTTQANASTPYMFRSIDPAPGLDTEGDWVLRSGDLEYPVTILGTELGPRGSLLRLRAETVLEIDKEWELIAKEPPSDGILLRYWMSGFFMRP